MVSCNYAETRAENSNAHYVIIDKTNAQNRMICHSFGMLKCQGKYGTLNRVLNKNH